MGSRDTSFDASTGIYRLDIDLWAMARRFARGHRLRLDIASADFPRFDRNSNRGGVDGAPIPATQSRRRYSSPHFLSTPVTSE